MCTSEDSYCCDKCAAFRGYFIGRNEETTEGSTDQGKLMYTCTCMSMISCGISGFSACITELFSHV